MSRHHKAAKWSNVSGTHRQRLAATLPARCLHCGRPVYATDKWDVAHLVDLARDGDTKRVGVAHRFCNRSAGGKLGAAMARAPRAVKSTSRREARW